MVALKCDDCGNYSFFTLKFISTYDNKKLILCVNCYDKFFELKSSND